MGHPKLIYDEFSFKPNLDLKKKIKLKLNIQIANLAIENKGLIETESL